ncbi:MAG: ABC transporter substrate-binding protein [Betaproteobacteria bacterium]|nr:ABC transporter substrate-binding protein [Betaproteobacteria bacterium]
MNTNPSRVVDAIGRVHALARADARIVSLVPSVTELLFELGVGDRLVGRTGFCIHPKDSIKTVPKVGGTKSVDIERIRELAPTHLIVNIDENEKPTVDQLANFVPNVIVTHPLGPLDNLPLYRLLGAIFGRESRAAELCEAFQKAYSDAVGACADLPRERVLYLLWKSPWMTVSRDTYVSRTLAAVGWDTVEIESRDRYPKIELTPALVSRVDRVLLSSEPYAFRERHLDEIRQTLAAANHYFVPTVLEEVESPVTVSLIDGEMTSWYGSRAIEGMRHLRCLRRDGCP